MAQDCPEPCDCHPLSAGFGITLADEAGCAPFATSLSHTLEPSVTTGYAFTWEITGGTYAWSEGSSETSEFPAIEFLESGVYQIGLTAVDPSGDGCNGTSSATMVAVAGPPEVMVTEVPELCAGEEGTVQVLVNPGNTALTAFAWGAMPGGTRWRFQRRLYRLLKPRVPMKWWRGHQCMRHQRRYRAGNGLSNTHIDGPVPRILGIAWVPMWTLWPKAMVNSRGVPIRNCSRAANR